MFNLIYLLDVVKIDTGDAVSFTFFTGYMAMFAAAVFFFFERGSVDSKWKTSLLVSGLITGIAAVHYFYMRDYYQLTKETPVALRYIDWTLTVPLMCVEFYLLLRPAGAKTSFMWKLIAASVLMLVAGYVGEAFTDGSMGHSVLWGVISTLGYLYILYSAWFGEAKQLADKSSSPAVQQGIKALAWFVLVGWAIYPIGYMAMPGGWLGPDGAGLLKATDMNLIYNIGDAVNKIGFGLVVYNIAVNETSKKNELNKERAVAA
ncbi:MAG: bacteriorhodopsin-like [Cytophagales bacterium]|jgi:bacteriorhodopsin|nr:bacteriorhodopsin-like [Cytophagales bacterium]